VTAIHLRVIASNDNSLMIMTGGDIKAQNFHSSNKEKKT